MDGKIYALVILCVVCVVGLLAAKLIDKIKSWDPVIEIEAEVLSKRVVTQTHRGTYGSVNGHYYYVTFRTVDGSVLELRTAEGSGKYEEGSKGILVYQDEKCEKFTPYK